MKHEPGPWFLKLNSWLNFRYHPIASHYLWQTNDLKKVKSFRFSPLACTYILIIWEKGCEKTDLFETFSNTCYRIRYIHVINANIIQIQILSWKRQWGRWLYAQKILLTSIQRSHSFVSESSISRYVQFQFGSASLQPIEIEKKFKVQDKMPHPYYWHHDFF